jgi:pimeloyl-ACP methyl ester carboxylesterase
MCQPQLPQLEGVDHHSVELPGLRMRVAEAGIGTPVLLLHGFPQHWWEWRKTIPVLAERFRVICPDLRGGRLERRPEARIHPRAAARRRRGAARRARS